MNPIPLPSNQDADHLKSLAVAFRVVSGLCAVCVNFAWIYVVVGILSIVSPPASVHSTRNDQATFTAGFGAVFIFIGFFILAAGYVVAYFGFKTAKSMDQRTNWNLCFGTSIALMLFQPIGLILGIFSLIVLNRPSVKEMFNPGV